MIVKVRYHESLKGGDGVLRTYDATVEKDIDESGLTGEQTVVKMRATLKFLHAEIHSSMHAEQVNDGVRGPEDKKH